MPRMRTVMPEFWQDEVIGELSRDARLTYIGLWNWADDNGRIEYSPAKTRIQLYPYDVDVTNDMVGIWLEELVAKGRIVCYTIDGHTYGVIPKFRKYQKTKKPSQWSYPTPPPGLVCEYVPTTTPDDDDEYPTSTPPVENQSPTRNPRNRNRNRVPLPEPLPESETCAFEAAYAVYPRKERRKEAQCCFNARVKDGVPAEDLVMAARNYASECARDATDPHFIMQPTTFFGPNERYVKYLAGVPPPAKYGNNGQKGKHVLDQIAEMEAAEAAVKDESF